ncbi:prion-inhibition and propagation-domain-containing protein [Dactylonectria macrodidyma]|uniref:Prion-inhibition and propagation-domain-containing protein n=1 Tax=Dactylonectria macrodidyma TaxID=307937 RepID=A0A9P9E7B7_9HYPO|nr:prion-inhibition and propagation-domain-containing protein [Dactylonectria macrodidyma]
MDPASAVGLAVGVASLAFDVFDNSIKLFKFFSAMVDMPKDCEQCRLQLMIEYNRLLAWGESVGLMNAQQGSHVAVNLGTNAIELCSIVSRIGWLLGEFRDMNARWKNELLVSQDDDELMSKQGYEDFDLAKEVSNLAITYEETKQARKYLRGTNHVIRWFSKGAGTAKEIVTHPSRVRWVMVDKGAFEALLEDLHFLTERMHELMEDYRRDRMENTTSKIYREMVLARNDISDLRNLLDAVTSLLKTTRENTDATHHSENDETLQDLLRLKKINCVSNELLLKIEDEQIFDIERYLQDLISVHRYNGSTLSDSFSYTKHDNISRATGPPRPRGTLSHVGEEIQVWIEWKTTGDIPKGPLEDNESKLRTATLAQMLHTKKPRHLYSPTCIGYIDDCAENRRYGWIFRMPDGSTEATVLKTLHEILGQNQYKPTLTQRTALAWRLASSLLYVHATNWLHKGVHSGNVVFTFDGDYYNPENPILSGFEYSRPTSNKTTGRSLDPKWDIYRWPRVQNEVPQAANSRKTWPEPSSQDPRIRGWLLGQERRPPFKDTNPLVELRDIAGDKYWRAICRCLVAHGDEGMSVDENSDQSQCSGTGIRLQSAFTEFVLEELKSVSI